MGRCGRLTSTVVAPSAVYTSMASRISAALRGSKPSKNSRKSPIFKPFSGRVIAAVPRKQLGDMFRDFDNVDPATLAAHGQINQTFLNTLSEVTAERNKRLVREQYDKAQSKVIPPTLPGAADFPAVAPPMEKPSAVISGGS